MESHEQLELPVQSQDEIELANLKEAVLAYSTDKAEMDALKKKVDANNKKIKDMMVKMSLTEVEVNGIKANYSVQERTSFVEDALLLKVKALGVEEDVIRTREYVDMNALENVIYNGKISASDLADCQSINLVETLRIGKAK